MAKFQWRNSPQKGQLTYTFSSWFAIFKKFLIHGNCTLVEQVRLKLNYETKKTFFTIKVVEVQTWVHRPSPCIHTPPHAVSKVTSMGSTQLALIRELVPKHIVFFKPYHEEFYKLSSDVCHVAGKIFSCKWGAHENTQFNMGVNGLRNWLYGTFNRAVVSITSGVVWRFRTTVNTLAVYYWSSNPANYIYKTSELWKN